MAINKNIDDYVNDKRLGIYFPGFPSYLTGQCVSLVKWYLGEMCGVADWQAARGNAKDFGDTLVNQGLATVVNVNDRKRGDIVVWKQDGGGYGHIGVLCSMDNVFEENVGLKGVPSAVYEGNTVHPSRLDPLSASWRVGPATFYRPNGYSEVVTPPPVVVPEVPVTPVATGFTDDDRKKLQAIYDIVAAIQALLAKIFK